MKWMCFNKIAGVKISSNPEISHSGNKNSYHPKRRTREMRGIIYRKMLITASTAIKHLIMIFAIFSYSHSEDNWDLYNNGSKTDIWNKDDGYRITAGSVTDGDKISIGKNVDVSFIIQKQIGAIAAVGIEAVSCESYDGSISNAMNIYASGRSKSGRILHCKPLWDFISDSASVSTQTANDTAILQKNNKIFLVKQILRSIQQKYAIDPYTGDFEKYLDSTEMLYNADSTLSIQYAIDRLLSDPQTTYIDNLDKFGQQKSATFGSIGIQITIKNKILTVAASQPGYPASRAGIQNGDQIIKIEGKTTSGISIEDAVLKLRGVPATPVAITIRRAGMPNDIEYTLIREVIKLKSVPYADIIDGDIGYVQLQSFSADAASEVEKSVGDLINKNIKGLILDLRNTPGGLLNQAIEVAGKFLPQKSLIVSALGRNKEQNKEYYSVVNPVYPKTLPLAVLVNNGSASTSEIVAGALKDLKRGVIIGNTTLAFGSIQSLFRFDPFNPNHALKIATAFYYSPSGVCIHGNGITPDTLIPDGVNSPTTTYMLRDQVFQRFAIAEKEKQGKSLSELISDDQAALIAFKSFLASSGIKYTTEMAAEKNDMTNEIHNALLYIEYGNGTAEYYRQYLLRDSQALTAAAILKDEKCYLGILQSHGSHH